MNHKAIDIENIKEWLGNMEHRMKKYTVPLVDIPEGDNNRNLWEAIFEKMMVESYPELRRYMSLDWYILNTQQNREIRT